MMMRPRPLRQGDTIAIISPATTVREEYIDGAARLLEGAGYRVRVMPHAKGPADGTFAATAADRLADFTEAYLNPQVRAILCARGGYGCIHLIDSIPPQMLAADPKWVIGFSDVSALHAMMLHAGAMSLHAPMAQRADHNGRHHLHLCGAPAQPAGGCRRTAARRQPCGAERTGRHAV